MKRIEKRYRHNEIATYVTTYRSPKVHTIQARGTLEDLNQYYDMHCLTVESLSQKLEGFDLIVSREVFELSHIYKGVLLITDIYEVLRDRVSELFRYDSDYDIDYTSIKSIAKSLNSATDYRLNVLYEVE